MARAALRDDLHAVHAAADRAGARRPTPTTRRPAGWPSGRTPTRAGRASRCDPEEICSDENADLARLSVGAAGRPHAALTADGR